MQLDGKVAIVTGGGYGIGKAIAIALAKEGADVVVAARTESALKKVAREIESLDRKSLAVVTDLLQPDAPAAMVAKALKKFGKIDILVNNSGAEGPISPVADMDLKGWNDLLAVNLTGAMLCSRFALEKSMIPCRSGVIINISAKSMGVTYEQVVANSNARAALGRMVKPEEVGALAVFLASEQSSAITGQTINVDAGANFN
jgi:NAD(P)-dependent dehydrogenase (short-subunit alcohol dehydrogenase family)